MSVDLTAPTDPAAVSSTASVVAVPKPAAVPSGPDPGLSVTVQVG